MKRIFLYWGPHKLHKEWGELVCERSIPIIPRWLPHSWRFVMPITQCFSLLTTLRTPRADTYFLEGFNCIIPAYLKKRQGTKIIMINSDTTFLLAPQWKGLKRWFYERTIKSVDGMISTSAYVKEGADRCHTVPNRIVHPYVDERFFSLKTDPSSTTLIQVGGLRDSKGTDLLLATYDLLKKKHQLKLILAGPVLETTYAKAAHTPGVTLTGWTDKPEEYLQQAGVYVNLARHEPFGVGVLEAMAAGVVPIVSEQCGVKEVVLQLDPTLVVPLDPAIVAERIAWLQSDIKRKKELSTKARELARLYTKEKCMKEFLAAFTSLEEELHA